MKIVRNDSGKELDMLLVNII